MSTDAVAVAVAAVLASISFLILTYNNRMRRAGRAVSIPLQGTPLVGFVMAVLAIVFIFVPGVFHTR